jgi:hypothetical protein
MIWWSPFPVLLSRSFGQSTKSKVIWDSHVRFTEQVIFDWFVFMDKYPFGEYINLEPDSLWWISPLINTWGIYKTQYLLHTLKSYHFPLFTLRRFNANKTYLLGDNGAHSRRPSTPSCFITQSLRPHWSIVGRIGIFMPPYWGIYMSQLTSSQYILIGSTFNEMWRIPWKNAVKTTRAVLNISYCVGHMSTRPWNCIAISRTQKSLDSCKMHHCTLW